MTTMSRAASRELPPQWRERDGYFCDSVPGVGPTLTFTPRWLSIETFFWDTYSPDGRSPPWWGLPPIARLTSGKLRGKSAPGCVAEWRALHR